MNLSVQKVQNMELSTFLQYSKKQQREFINSVDIQKINETYDLDLFKKFVAMKIFMEARHAAEDKSLFNITAQFRNFIALIAPAVALGADYGNDPEDKSSTGRGVRGRYLAMNAEEEYDETEGEDRVDEASNGYRLFHISNIGSYAWERKFFKMGFSNDTFYTGSVKTRRDLIESFVKMGPCTYYDDIKRWDLAKETDVRQLFKEIKKETEYENTFGYDVYSVAAFCVNGLLSLSWQSSWFGLVLVPLALAITLAVYAAIIPLSLTLYTVEKLLIDPIKWGLNALGKDENEAFIEEAFHGETCTI